MMLSALLQMAVLAPGAAIPTPEVREEVIASAPRMTHTPAIRIPIDLVNRCVKSEVVFEFTILESGDIGNIEIVSPPSEYDQLVIDRIGLTWKATPYRSDSLTRARSRVDFDPCPDAG